MRGIMKRSFVLRTFSVLSVLLYVFLILFSKINLKIIYELWFSTALFFLANILFLRSVFYKINSALWFSVVLYVCFLVGVFGKTFEFSTIQYISGYLFSFTYASFVVFIFFRQRFHIKTFAFLSAVVLVLFMYSVGYLGYVAFVSLLSFVICLLVSWIINTVRLNLRKV